MLSRASIVEEESAETGGQAEVGAWWRLIFLDVLWIHIYVVVILCQTQMRAKILPGRLGSGYLPWPSLIGHLSWLNRLLSSPTPTPRARRPKKVHSSSVSTLWSHKHTSYFFNLVASIFTLLVLSLLCWSVAGLILYWRNFWSALIKDSQQMISHRQLAGIISNH